MRVAALYDVHGDAVGARSGAGGGRRATRSSSAATASTARTPRETSRERGARRARSPRQRRALSRGSGSASSCADDLRWLVDCRSRVELDGILYCHATPADNTADRRPRSHPTTDARDDASAARRARVVIGHTHHQFDRRVGDLRVVNAGSVGMAVRGRGRRVLAARRATASPRFMRTPFDVERAVARRPRERLAGGRGVRRREPARRAVRATRRSRCSRASEIEDRDRPGRAPARARRLVLRRAAERRPALVEGRRDGSSPAAARSRWSSRGAPSGRPVIKLDRAGRARRADRGRARRSCRRPGTTSTTRSSSSGSRSWRRPGARSEP